MSNTRSLFPPFGDPWLSCLLPSHYFSHLTQRADSFEKTLGKIEGRRKSGQQQWMSCLDDIDSVDMNLSKLWEIVKDREACLAAVHGVTKRPSQLSD